MKTVVMQWLAAFLLTINVLIFLGINKGQLESRPANEISNLDVNRESIRLLSEVEAEGLSVPSSPNPASLRPLPVPTGTATEREVAAADTAPMGRVCFRVGPFEKGASWQDAMGWFQQQSQIQHRTRTVERSLRSIDVYLGPYPSMELVQPTLDMLEERALDYIISEREDGWQVSLGFFTQEKLAFRYMDRLRNEGIEFKYQPEYRSLGPWYWVEVETSRGFAEILRNRDWQDEMVTVTQTSCTAMAAG